MNPANESHAIPMSESIERTLRNLAATGMDYEALASVYRIGFLSGEVATREAQERRIDQALGTARVVPMFLKRQAY
jgi:ATP-dependent RNA circularization protein (DNA/RNA ligase family)